MFDNRTIYALNKKDTDAIVYTDVEGKMLRLTYTDFASKEEFDIWKKWSDEQYRQWDNSDTLYSKHNVSFLNIAECTTSVQAPDTLIEQKEEELGQIRHRRSQIQLIQSLLTEIQFRRLWMHFALGMTLDSIGEKEGISHQSTSKSILNAVRKIKYFFLTKNGVQKTPKKDDK